MDEGEGAESDEERNYMQRDEEEKENCGGKDSHEEQKLDEGENSKSDNYFNLLETKQINTLISVPDLSNSLNVYSQLNQAQGGGMRLEEDEEGVINTMSQNKSMSVQS